MQAHLILAFGAGARDKSICQELASSFAVQLLNGLLHELPCPVQRVENALGSQIHTHQHGNPTHSSIHRHQGLLWTIPYSDLSEYAIR